MQLYDMSVLIFFMMPFYFISIIVGALLERPPKSKADLHQDSPSVRLWKRKQTERLKTLRLEKAQLILRLSKPPNMNDPGEYLAAITRRDDTIREIQQLEKTEHLFTVPAGTLLIEKPSPL